MDTPRLVPVVQAPPGGVHCPIPHPLLCFRFGMDTPTPPWEHPSGGCWVERRLELLLQGNSPKCPRGSFSVWEKSSCSILWLPPYKEGPDLSHSPLLQLGWGLSGSGSHADQLSTLLGQRLWSPWVFHFVLIPLPATLGNQVSHSVAQALFGRGGGR